MSGDRPDILELGSERFRALFHPYGARLLALYLRNPDRSETNIALGLEQPEDYVNQDTRIGAICGRFANRICNARYQQDGVTVQLDANEGPNQLHGGQTGFDRRDWTLASAEADSISFNLAVPDGDQGYPGAMQAQVTYAVVGDDRLQCRLTATCDRPTIVNLTNHAYWNLSGDFSHSAEGHRLRIAAAAYLPVDAGKIPLPGRTQVAGTAFDFRDSALIRERLEDSGGFDHNFCLDGARGTLRPVAWLEDPASGRSLQLSTTEAGLQFYLARHFRPTMRSREGLVLHPSAGIALEPQCFPDSPNRPDFPSPRLQPGETYEHLIEWQFGIAG